MAEKKIRTASWFIDQLNVYQSANSDYASLKKNFKIREAEYVVIIQSLTDKKPGDPLQHELVLGRRGSGKSTLLKRIEIEIAENPKLNKKYIPVNLAEEQAGIYRLFDLWEEVIKELNCRLGTNIKAKDYKQFETDNAYTRYLHSLIHETCSRHKKSLVLLLDNFDRIVENFTDDGSLLRETLTNYNDLVIIAASTRMDEHFWQHDKPFYEFFRRHRLEALGREEMYKLLYHWSDALGIPELRKFIDNNPGKIENVRILTDGLPRTLQFFIQMVLQDAQSQGYDYLKKIMDYMTPQYQERLNYLPAPLRKTILEMAFLWEGCTTKQLAEVLRMESKLVSANLKTLTDKGIVDRIGTSTKNHLYRIAERFFNMWLIITQGNPEQKRKAKWLSIFLENWYDATDFKTLAKSHLEKLESKKFGYKEALIFSKALSQSRYTTIAERDRIIELTEQLKDGYSDYSLVELPQKASGIIAEVNKMVEEKKYKEALRLAETIENEEGGDKFNDMGLIYEHQKEISKAQEYYLLAIKKGNTVALSNIALLYTQQERFSEAEKYYLLAIEKRDAMALFDLALLYAQQGRFSEAEKYYLLAIEKGVTGALTNLASLYAKQKNYTEAEKYFILAIEKGEIYALNNLALLYLWQKKFTEAEKYFLLAIEKGEIYALNNLALLYVNEGKVKDAEKYYLLAVEKGNINSVNNLALLYNKQNRFSEAEKCLLLGVEEDDIDALYNLALLYTQQERFSEAEKYYLLALEVEESDTGVLYNLALLYTQQEEFSEAEKYYLLAIEKGETRAYNNLVVSYYEQNTNKQKALEYYNKGKSYFIPDFLIIAELWNGIFNNVEARIEELIKSDISKNYYDFIFHLLIHQQKNIVLHLFEHKEFGKELRDKYAVLYYVSLLLNNKTVDNLTLRIPPEIQETINEVIKKLEEKQKFYGYMQ